MLTLKPIKGLLCNLENKIERGTVMVRPMIVCYSAEEVFFFVVSGSFWRIDYPILVKMLVVQILGYLATKKHHVVIFQSQTDKII